MEELIGRTLGRYRIIKILGEGGMGAVFKAEDHELKRNVAIKVMNTKYASRPDFGDLFRQEARATAALDHPHIVKVYDFGQDEDRLYLVMEFIAGATLRQLMREMRDESRWLTAGESVSLVRDVAFALEFAHNQGILHQDVKPGNIMLKQQGTIVDSQTGVVQPIVMDLGLARIQGGEDIQGRTGTSFGGTPAYMSPEQAFGREVDVRSDIYSLGVLLYELVLGRVPFVIRSYSQAREIHTDQPPPVPSSLRPDIDPALEEILLRCLAKNPSQRFASAAEMGMALQGLPEHIFYLSVPPTATEGTAELQAVHLQSLDHTPAPVTPTPFQPTSTSSRSIQYQIVVSGPDKKPFGLSNAKNRIQIGREEGCDLVLDDDQVSRLHATIEFDGSRYQVTDERSANGVYLGSRRLHGGQTVPWSPDTPLRMGGHVFMLKPAAEGTPPPPPVPVQKGSASTFHEAEPSAVAAPFWKLTGLLISGLLLLSLLGIGFILWQMDLVDTLVAIGAATETPTHTHTPKLAATKPTATAEPTKTNTPKPSSTLASNSTSGPINATSTSRPTATKTRRPTSTPKPTSTRTPKPTSTPKATSTPKPTNRVPTSTRTPTNASSSSSSSSGNGITQPASRESVSGSIMVLGNASHRDFEKWQLDILLYGDEQQTKSIQIGERAAQGQTFARLDTTKYPNGNHTLRLRVVRSDSNYDEYFTSIRINN